MVRIVLPKRREIGKQMMKIGHCQMNARNLRSDMECRFAHVEERVLHAQTLVPGKLFEECGDDPCSNVGEILIPCESFLHRSDLGIRSTLRSSRERYVKGLHGSAWEHTLIGN